MANEYVSGTDEAVSQSDCQIIYQPDKSGDLKIDLQSKVALMYDKSIKALAKQTLDELGITHGRLSILDGGALPFLIRARIEAAVKSAHPDLTVESLPELKEFTKYESTRDRFRRSRIYVPGSQAKLMLNVGIHKPDGVILDLEDSVAPAEKPSARLIVRNALRTLDFFGAERMVRINQGDLGLEDLQAIVPTPVDLLLLPKIETVAEIDRIETEIARLSTECKRTRPIYLMPIIESARGIGNAYQIAAASPNNVALAIGLEDYTADIGVQRTLEGNESFYARSVVVNAARAAQLQPIATVFSDVQDMAGLRTAAVQAKALGFDGMGAIHPRQIKVINEAFAPDSTEIDKACKIVLAFEDAETRGLGVVSLGSKMIDPPVVKRALRIVDTAIAMGLLDADWRSA
ncbi:aldolase/citrate lyase family protein [Candidatus Neomarinimicrobiota bacterium]